MDASRAAGRRRPRRPTAAGAAAEPGITNTQEAGVDEGGIVKMRGDILVILRRGRLFTVSTGRRRDAADRFDRRLPARRGRRAATGMTRC